MTGLVSRAYCEVLDVQEKISKKNKPYYLITLGDKETYFRGEFFLSDRADISNIAKHVKSEVLFSHEVRGYDVSTSVVSVKQVK